MENPNVREILNEWLVGNGYGGLCNTDCGCSADDLMPCSHPSPFCKAGYLVACCECEEQEVCGFGQEYDYLISEEKGSCPMKGAA